MPPLCGAQHRNSFSEESELSHGVFCSETVLCPSCGAIVKRSSLWPKNTATYHRPPLRVRSNPINHQPPDPPPVDHPPPDDRSGASYDIDSGDNTTVIIGSIVGVALLLLVLALVCCCCMASRKSRFRDKKRKKEKEKEKSKDKDKEKGKDKDKDKKDKEPPYRGYPCGNFQQVQDWINHHPGDYYPAIPQMPPFAHDGFGRQPGMGGETDAWQMGYGGGGWPFR